MSADDYPRRRPIRGPISQPFLARYAGDCVACAKPIVVGDSVVAYGKISASRKTRELWGYAHTTCAYRGETV